MFFAVAAATYASLDVMLPKARPPSVRHPQPVPHMLGPTAPILHRIIV
jgi:hypothetical protein